MLDLPDITNGTWLDWNGSLRRAMGPARRPFAEAAYDVVELCYPDEWVRGLAAEGYEAVRRGEVSVISEDTALARLAES